MVDNVCFKMMMRKNIVFGLVDICAFKRLWCGWKKNPFLLGYKLQLAKQGLNMIFVHVIWVCFDFHHCKITSLNYITATTTTKPYPTK